MDTRGYYVHCRTSPTGDINEWRRVEAEPVSIPGWTHLDLFVHPTPLPGGRWSESRWHVSEGRTGMKVSSGLSPESAVARAASRLAEGYALEDAIGDAITAALAEYGLSPRYQEEAPGVT